MAEVTEAAYQNIRNHLQTTWGYIELRNNEGAPITRIPIGTDARAKWVHSAGDRTLNVQVTVKGADADIPIPSIIGGAALYNVATGGEAFTVETFTLSYIMDASDTCVINHLVEVPTLGA